MCQGNDGSNEYAGISVDGNRTIPVHNGDSLEICMARETTRFLKINKVSFLETLRTKMRGN
jgi:NAD+ kinase